MLVNVPLRDPADIRWDMARPGFLTALLPFLGKVATTALAVGGAVSAVQGVGRAIQGGNGAIVPYSAGGQPQLTFPQRAYEAIVPGTQYPSRGERPRRMQAVYTQAQRRISSWPVRVWPRRMNVLNPRALSRAGRRVKGFMRRARRLERVIPHKRSSYRRPGRRKR
jgi:hypothetical protein